MRGGRRGGGPPQGRRNQPLQNNTIMLPFEDAERLAQDPMNGIEMTSVRGNMALLPGDLDNAENKVTQLLSTKLFHYVPACRGVLMSFRNVELVKPVASIFDERPFAHIKYTCEAVVLKLAAGKKLSGTCQTPNMFAIFGSHKQGDRGGHAL